MGEVLCPCTSWSQWRSLGHISHTVQLQLLNCYLMCMEFIPVDSMVINHIMVHVLSTETSSSEESSESTEESSDDDRKKR